MLLVYWRGKVFAVIMCETSVYTTLERYANDHLWRPTIDDVACHLQCTISVPVFTNSRVKFLLRFPFKSRTMFPSTSPNL